MRSIARCLLVTGVVWSGVLALPLRSVADQTPPNAIPKEAVPNGAASQASVAAGKSILIDSSAASKPIATANGSLADAQAISPKEVLLNGKAVGETSITIWRVDDTRLVYDLTVRPSAQKINPEMQPGEGK